MIKATPSSAPKPSPIPTDLNVLIPHPKTPWNMSYSLFGRITSQNSEPFKLCEILNSDTEFNFILKYFEYHKPSGYSIKRIVCIHNPSHTQVFEGTLKNMEQEANNPVFSPTGKEEEPKLERNRALARWEKQVAQFSPVEIKSSNSRAPDSCFKVKVLPLWHGSSEEVCKSVCSSGFTSFGKHHHIQESAEFAKKGKNVSTDKGYFGSGIYFTNSAHYASLYSQGRLLFAWVSMREPYPVVSDVMHPNKCSDMIKLQAKEHYQNYNAHYIPVASIEPHNPKCMEYYPCYKDQPAAWDEFVVFEKAQTLPRFWIELGVDLPTVVLSELLNAGELLTLVLNLLDKEEIKNNAALSALLQAKVDHILDIPETIPLSAEDEKFFKLAKRLMLEGDKINSSVASLLLRNGSPAIDHSPMKPLSSPMYTPSSIQPMWTPPSSNFNLPPVPPSFPISLGEDKYQTTPYPNVQKPQPSVPIIPDKDKYQTTPSPSIQKPQPSVPILSEEEEYQKGCSYAKSGDLKQAFLSYQKAAEKGHVEAQYRLARCYLYREGVSKDKKKEEEWYRKAAAQGHLIAQGECYVQGYGGEKDLKKAVKCFEKAADQGNPDGQLNLGLCYQYGHGVSQDWKKAVKWFQKAADQGDARSQNILGYCFGKGYGIKQNDKEALKWLLKAAEQGNDSAQSSLGVCYKDGIGVTQDYKEAEKWFKKAADQGNANAQKALMYRSSWGKSFSFKD